MLKATAILLAAGFSTRMGACKASLPWQGEYTLLSYQLTQLMHANVLPVVVLGQHNAYLRDITYLRDSTKGLQPNIFVVNPEAEKGKVTSILRGLSELPNQWDVVLVSAVDQPRSVTVYRQLLNAFTEVRALITMPSYRGRTGHPILFSRALLSQLYTIQDESLGLRRVVREHRASTQYVPMETPEVLCDINTPTQYRQAQESLL